jgi:hypothetical protein
MKIKLLVSRAGADFVQNRGEEIEVEQAEAVRMVEAGQAVPVAAPKIERAVATKAKEKR